MKIEVYDVMGRIVWYGKDRMKWIIRNRAARLSKYSETLRQALSNKMIVGKQCTNTGSWNLMSYLNKELVHQKHNLKE